MTKEEARGLVYSAFFRIVRQLNPIPIEDFFKTKIEETLPENESPSGWPDFWWESIAVEIQNAVMSRKEYILDFNAKWLKDNKSKPWSKLINYMDYKIVPL